MNLEYLIEDTKREVNLRKTDKSEDIGALSKIVNKILEIAPNEENTELENVFKEICAIDKYTGEFYSSFIQKTFPFSKRLMRHAINVEPYYNNNDMALDAYLIFAAEEIGLDKKETIMPFINEIMSHQGGYYFELVSKIREYKKIVPTNEIKKDLIEIFKTSEFYETRNKALLSCVYLGIVEIEEPLKEMIKIQIKAFDEFETKIETQNAYKLESSLTTMSKNISYFLEAFSELNFGDFKQEASELHQVCRQLHKLTAYKLAEEKYTTPYKQIYENSKHLIKQIKLKFEI